MGASQSIPDSVDVDEITNNTGLSKKQIASLWTRFHELDRDGRGDTKGYKGYLHADDFRRVPKFDENPIAERLITVILNDYGSDGKLNFPQFVYFMSTFGQSERGGHHHHHHHQGKRHSIPTPARPSTKTDLENVKYSYDDTPKTRKIKFMFRVKFLWNRKKKSRISICLDVWHRPRRSFVERRCSRNTEKHGNLTRFDWDSHFVFCWIRSVKSATTKRRSLLRKSLVNSPMINRTQLFR